MAMSILQVSQGHENQGSGITHAVNGLLNGLPESQVSVSLFSLTEHSRDLEGQEGVYFFPMTKGPRCVPISVPVSRLLANRIREHESSVIHAHGLWCASTIYAAKACLKSNRSLVLSVHGMLSKEAMEYSKFKKIVFDWVLQKSALQHVYCFHATSEAEYVDIRRHGIRSPVAIIPWGVHAKMNTTSASNPSRRPYVLALSRLHPIKNLDSLILAWEKIIPKYKNWNLIICGPGDQAYKDYLKSMALKRGAGSIEIIEGRYGAEKVRLMQDAELFILPSKSENFALTVAESLSAGTAVIVSKNTPWQAVVNSGCGWVIDTDVNSISSALDNAMALKATERVRMGLRGTDFIQTTYDWSVTGEMFCELYKWCDNQAPQPTFVYSD